MSRDVAVEMEGFLIMSPFPSPDEKGAGSPPRLLLGQDEGLGNASRSPSAATRGGGGHGFSCYEQEMAAQCVPAADSPNFLHSREVLEGCADPEAGGVRAPAQPAERH